jgi:uncharacterized repeat protein (TIGR01451 family)
MKKIAILLLVGIVLIPACCQAPKQVKAPPPKPMPVAQAPPASPCAAATMAKSEQVFPVAANAIRLEKMVPSHTQTNVPFDYRIKVTNVTDTALNDVVVTDMIPAGIKFKESDPEMVSIEGGKAVWVLGTMAAQSSQMISVKAAGRLIGTFTTCADVTYDSPLCAQIKVTEPMLKLAKTAPMETTHCDRIEMGYVVTNIGTGAVCGITISEQLPDGMFTADGAKMIEFQLDSLNEGESQTFSKMVDAIRPATYSSSATATFNPGGRVTSNMTSTIALEPVLQLTQIGPPEQILGRNLKYEFTVTNTGDAISKDTILEVMVPEHVDFEDATAGGTFSRSSPGKIRWDLGTIEEGETVTVFATLITNQPGMVLTDAKVTAYCAQDAEASAITNVTGIPAILLEVIDVQDPVEIGEGDTYIITVTNQGSKADTNIQIVCELEPGMQYVSSSGPTNAMVVANKITFAPLMQLDPKEKVEWKIAIKALGEGDWRFKTNMTSNELTRPVTETEATRIFK